MKLRHLAFGAAGVVVGLVAVFNLREATQSTHHPVPPDSQAVIVLDAHRHHGEPGQTVDKMVHALALRCRLEVFRSDLVEVSPMGGDRFRVVYEPGMDRSDARQLRGCLKDFTIDHLKVDIESFDPT